jgi:hypothetical protein
MPETFVHPLRSGPRKLGRSERSAHLIGFNLRDYVDVEKALDLINKRRAEGKGAIHEATTIDWSLLVKVWEMFLNERLGDCTCAGAAHAGMIFNAAVGHVYLPTDEDIERMYEHSGWNPKESEATDQGWTLVGAAEFLKTIGILGTETSPAPDIEAFSEVSVDDDDAAEVASELFGGIYTGCVIREAADNQFGEGKEWTSVPGSPELGGHCIHEAKTVLRESGLYVTWGALQPADEAWKKENVDEKVNFVPKAWEEKVPPEVVEAGVVDFAELEKLVSQYQTA